MKIEIIAEIAQGYEGNPKLAELLVKGAIAAQCDAVKLQLVYADELCVPNYPYYDFFKSLEMNQITWSNLAQSVHEAGKKIYFDIYGLESLKMALELKADGVKISTTDFYNFPLIKTAFESFETVFLSTGGVPVEDIDEVISRFKTPARLSLMHGFQAEPTSIADNNLNRINTLKHRFPGVEIGFMDHSLGSDEEALYLPLLALGLGVNCIEKHITLDYSLEIEDYISALSVDRFKVFVALMRKMEPALGSKELILTAKEIEYKKKAGKLAVASRNMTAGEVILDTDVAMKRVSTIPTDIYCSRVDDILGKSISVDIEKDQPFEKNYIK